MLDQHSPADVMAAVAQEVLTQRWTAEIDLLMHDIAQELLRQKHHAVVTVKSAQPLPKKRIVQLENWLRKHLQATTITLDTMVDDTLKGGIAVTTPKGVLDATVVERLNQLNQL